MSQAVQLQIENFLQSNEQQLSEISVDNPELYYSIFQVLDFVNAKFGRGTPLPKLVAVQKEGEQPEAVTVNTHTGEVSVGQQTQATFEVGDLFKSKVAFRTYEIMEIDGTDSVKVQDDLGKITLMNYADVSDLVKAEIWQRFTAPAPQQVSASQQPLPTAGSATTDPEAVMTIQELKDAIAGLELIADFDDEAKEELKRLKVELKQLKKKKA